MTRFFLTRLDIAVNVLLDILPLNGRTHARTGTLNPVLKAGLSSRGGNLRRMLVFNFP